MYNKTEVMTYTYSMRQKTTYIVIVAAMLCVVGCKSKEHQVDLSDAQKLEILDMKVKKHQNDCSLLAERAQLLLKLGRTQEAVYDINRASNIEPDNVEYRLIQADAALANGDRSGCYNALTEAERIDPDNKEVQLKLGEFTFYTGDYDRALKSLSKVTETDPTNRTALMIKGHVYKETGDTASAVTLFRKVCDLYPDYEPAFEELGILYATRGNAMALEYLSTALRLSPNSTETLYALAMYYQEQEELEKAENLYNQLLDINPNSADALHNLGYIELFYYRDYERAIEYMNKALEADPTNLNALVDRGCAYELSDLPDKARADFMTALQIDGKYQPALDGLARIK